MKIAVVSSQVFAVGADGVAGLKGYGGLEQIAYQTAVGLAQRGHEVTLIAPDGSTCPNGKVFHTGPPGVIDEYRAYSGVTYKVKHPDGKEEERKQPPFWPVLFEQDVVIDNSWSKWAYMLKKEGALKAPVLGVMHAPVNTMYQTLPPVEKPCIVCISQDQASHLKALFGKEAMVAYNGCDPLMYKPLGTPRSKRFLFLARFSSVKSPHLAIEACKKAGVGLDLVGDTSITNEPAYLEHCKSMCDGEQIRLVGSCSRGEAVWWYSQAHAFIHPTSTFREPFGLAPVEAMLCGCPVIAWDNGALRETVAKGESGLLASSFDEMVDHIKTLSSVNLEDGSRDRCRQWALQFSVENMVSQYEFLCRKALETGGW